MYIVSNLTKQTTTNFATPWSSSLLCLCVLARDRKMSLIQMSSVEEAIQGLMDLHNYDMGGNHHLKVSFSKSTI